MSVPWYLMAKGKGGGGYKTASGPIVSINDALAAPLRSLVANIDPVQEGTGDPSPDNVRPISGWSAVNVWVKPTYDPTANPTATIQLGQTVYGGTLDVTNGVLTVDRAYALLNDPDKWVAVSSNTQDFEYTQLFNDRKLYSTSFQGLICSAFAVDFSAAVYMRWTSSASKKVGIKNNTSAYTLSDIQQMAQGNQIAIVYELSTPITIPLTPTEISTVQGQNNVWADCGDVTVEYLSAGGANPDLMKLAVAFMGRK